MDYPRAGNGKAVASTNDWIKGWLMICYELSKGNYRIGWIENKYLKKVQSIPPLEFQEDTYFVSRMDCTPTDDPLGTGRSLFTLPARTEVQLLAMLDGWHYVRLEWQGQIWMAFI